MFGMPGQCRFWGPWAGLAEGAVGALVLVDTRLEASFEVLDQMERQAEHLPYAVAVNQFPGSSQYEPGELRKFLPS